VRCNERLCYRQWSSSSRRHANDPVGYAETHTPQLRGYLLAGASQTAYAHRESSTSHGAIADGARKWQRPYELRRANIRRSFRARENAWASIAEDHARKKKLGLTPQTRKTILPIRAAKNRLASQSLHLIGKAGLGSTNRTEGPSLSAPGDHRGITTHTCSDPLLCILSALPPSIRRWSVCRSALSGRPCCRMSSHARLITGYGRLQPTADSKTDRRGARSLILV